MGASSEKEVAMKNSSLPDGIPVLARGGHRSPRRGACFMEYASVLAGERWSDHPSCTHPLLGQLARQVNDHTSDDERQKLTPLIPSVVGRRGDEHTWVTVAVAVAATVILDVPEPTQRVLSGGLRQAEQVCADAAPDLAAARQQALVALTLVPDAVAWIERLGVRRRISAKTFAKRCAPTIVRCAVDGVVATGRADSDRLLRTMLEAGIAACPAPQTEIVTPAVSKVRPFRR
jgi:hypothetical protein